MIKQKDLTFLKSLNETIQKANSKNIMKKQHSCHLCKEEISFKMKEIDF